MKDNYRYTLEGSKHPNGSRVYARGNASQKKHYCPCGARKKRFVRYVDTKTGEYLPSEYGRCDRVINCAYWLNPYNDGYSKMIWERERGECSGNWKTRCTKPKPPPPKPIPVSYIDMNYVKQSMCQYENNYFVQRLIALFGKEITQSLIKKYMIGTASVKTGANVFWQIDNDYRIRSGKIMLYNPETGRRQNYNNWVHSILLKKGMLKEFNLSICLYGLHLLDSEPKEKPVAICESEKTAIIASVYLPEFTWMAAGALEWLSNERLKPLRGRRVVLFPDLSAYDRWREKAKIIPDIDISVSKFLETRATEEDKTNGLDLADYLEKFNYTEFNLPPGYKYETFTRFDGVEVKNLINADGYPAAWDD